VEAEELLEEHTHLLEARVRRCVVLEEEATGDAEMSLGLGRRRLRHSEGVFGSVKSSEAGLAKPI